MREVIMITPAISVVIPVYNVENEYLSKCMESVLMQKGADFEIIMIDDGSTNGCSEWCDDWAKKDSRIRAIHKKNGGVSSARNVGIKESRGNYLIFIDPDDWWEPNLIERSYEAISKNDCDMLFFGFYEEYPNRQFLRSCGENTGKFFEVDKNLRKSVELGLVDNTVRKIPAIIGACWNSMIKKSIVIDNEIYFPEDIFHGEDSVFIIRLVEAALKIGILDLAFYHYRYNLKSVTKRFVPQFETNHEKTIRSFYQIVSFLHNDPDFRDSFAYSVAYKYCVVLMQDYFHMDNKEKMKDKKKRWEVLAKDSAFADILRNADYKSLFRKSPSYCAVTFFTFKHRCFYIVALLSVLGRIRLNARAKI